MERTALIVAGGRGTRMKSDLPKQFMLLLDIPVLMHTMERFAQADVNTQIILVLPPDQIDFWNKLCAQMDFDLPHQVVAGGETRFDSVKNGLAQCPTQGVIGIHDGVRPLVSIELIDACYQKAAEAGSAIPCVPIAQSLRKVAEDASHPIERDGVFAVQTPQCFTAASIIEAYEKAEHNAFTDDATVLEAANLGVNVIEGEPTNLKITTAADLLIAEALLSRSQ